MQLINLSQHARDPKYYNRDRDMITALVWNSIKKTLIKAGREDLFGYIKSVKVTEKTISIITGKAVVNQELSLIREDIVCGLNTIKQGYSLRLR